MLLCEVFRTPKSTMVYVFQEKIKYEVGFCVQSHVLTCSLIKSKCVFRLIKKLCKAVDMLKIQNTGFK